MPTYNTGVTRDASNDPLVPQPVSDQVIQDMPSASVMLQRARKITMGTKTLRMPVVDVLPQVYFVSGDAGLKQTSAQDWKGLDLVAEELAAIVPVPDAYMADSQIPVWDEIRPRMVEALGAAIDAACLFGVNKPSTWGTAIYTGAVAAGNTIAEGAGTDLAQDVSNLGALIATNGYKVTGFASAPGFNWRLVGLRSEGSGVPIYQPNLQGPTAGSLYGYPLNEVTDGGWNAAEADLIAGDWSKAIIGMRQDISFKIFDQGVINDADGNVIWNAMQNDGVALRVVMRLGFQVANPANRLQPTEADRFPFGAITASGAS